MKSAEIRQAFLDYFAGKQHQVVASSSLVPADDPTLLFTNAGMVQFKDVFLGAEKRPYTRATSSQRCVRAGGKHNDLENVGYTARHHTFFEMLGNFSFGDYFKHEAIKYAWEFLTEVLGLPEEKLWVTVHVSDDEAADIWLKQIGVSADRFSRLDEDNFWQMGDTGPCGPSSEIFYDHGEHLPGGPPGSADDDLDRYIEIWNLVFMQYERQVDGELIPLPKPSVDTGMGLERIAAVLQKVHSNYEIDLFQALLAAAAKAVNCSDLEEKSLRVIADHIRSCAFLVCDGVLPSNEGRGYVLRRIIRRAVRHGNKLGQKGSFFYTLVAALCEQMGEAYPELVAAKAQIETVLKAEEEQFAKTLDKGMAVLEAKLAESEGTQLSGEVVFTLYDTYGFPVDLTNDIARERNLTLDLDAYEQLMAEQKRKSKEAGAFKVDYTRHLSVEGETKFTGYAALSGQAKVLALYIDGEPVQRISAGEQAVVILDNTPFYAESGGQVGDRGVLHTDSCRFEVNDCVKSGSHYLHLGSLVQGALEQGQSLFSQVDADRRMSITRNHSATHLLHAALRDQFGEHVVQKGSLNDEDKLRFDFSHGEAIGTDQLQQITARVNQQICANSAVNTELCDMETAMDKGAMALFGEKYGDQVRVVTMGEDDFSVELCGGTHVKNVGEIGCFFLRSESGVAAGIRRIEAVTGEKAIAEVAALQKTNAHLSAMLKTPPEKLEEKLDSVLRHTKSLEKQVAQLKAKVASASADEWVNEAKQLGDYALLVKTIEGADNKALRDSVDKLRDKLGQSVVLLAGINDGKIALVAGVSKALTTRVKAGDVVKHVATQIGGKGGGRPDMAQGGGSDVAALPAAMQSVYTWLSASD